MTSHGLITPGRRRQVIFWLVWLLWCSAVAGGLLAMPVIRQEHFWNWLGSQPLVIEALTRQQRWDAALARVERLETELPWDPRSAHRRANILLGRIADRTANPASDPRVEEAYAHAVHQYMSTAMYPYLLSPQWQHRMASALWQWASCLAQQSRWRTVGFCLQVAADIDPSMAGGILRELHRQASDPRTVAPEVLETTAMMAIWHRSPREAEEVIEHLRSGLDTVDHLRLQTMLRLYHVEAPDPDYSAAEEFPILSDLRLRLAFLQLQSDGIHRAGRRRVTQETIDRALRAQRENLIRLRTPLIEPISSSESLIDAEAFPEVPEGGRAMLVNGAMNLQWPEGEQVGPVCYVIALGASALNVWPVLEIVVNGGEPQLRYVRSDRWMALPVEVPGERVDTLAIRYINDGGYPLLSEDGRVLATLEDRNVIIAGVWAERPLGESPGRDSAESEAR